MSDTPPLTYLTPRSGRPTQAYLSAELELEVPLRYTQFVSDLYDFGRGDVEACIKAFDTSLGLFPAGSSARYDGTPPELFPFGQTGCDGDHYGFLLRAPELNLPDLPLCHYCPMDSDGVILVGSDTEAGIAAIMARLLSYDFIPDEEKSLIREVASACNIIPVAHPPRDLIPPDGWKFVPSSDGIGTLASVEFFDPRDTHPLMVDVSPGIAVDAAERAMNSGYFATALHALREGQWFNWFNEPLLLAQRMIDAYEALNRPQLATQMANTISDWQAAKLS